MDNISYFEVTQIGDITNTFVMIDKGNNEFICMLKADYDEQQKAAELGGTL